MNHVPNKFFYDESNAILLCGRHVEATVNFAGCFQEVNQKRYNLFDLF